MEHRHWIDFGLMWLLHFVLFVLAFVVLDHVDPTPESRVHSSILLVPVASVLISWQSVVGLDRVASVLHQSGLAMLASTASRRKEEHL